MKSFKKLLSLVLVVSFLFTDLAVQLTGLNEGRVVYASESEPSVNIRYDNFSDLSALQVNGDPIKESEIRFESGKDKAESVFSKEKIKLTDNLSFSTYFTFTNTYTEEPSEGEKGGFLFILQPEANSKVATDFSHDIAKSFSLAFTSDFYELGGTARVKSSDSRVHIASLKDVKLASTATYRCEVSATSYSNGKYDEGGRTFLGDFSPAVKGMSITYNVCFGYDGSENKLYLICSDGKNIIRYDTYINLLEQFGEIPVDGVYAGFMGSMGGGGTSTAIKQWYFRNDTNIIDEQLVTSDSDWIKDVICGSNPSLDDVRESLYLPTVGYYNSNISWSVPDDNGVVNDDGTVINPSIGEEAKKVTLTATISKGEAGPVVKTFEVTVRQKDEDVLDEDKKWLTEDIVRGENTDLDNVVTYLSLPAEGMHGSSIGWISSDTKYVETSGVVKRPLYTEGDKKVTLQAVISKGYLTPEFKDFEVTVKKQAAADTDRLAEDSLWLSDSLILNGNSGISNILTNLYLPTKGVNGSSIAWTSNKPLVVTSYGEVNRPDFTVGAGEQVKLTAELNIGDERITKDFYLFIIARGKSNEQCVTDDYAWLDLSRILLDNPNENNITKPLNLPTLGANGSSISWESSDERFVKPDGSVIRPTYTQRDQIITLTATIKKSGTQKSKEFEIMVPALSPTNKELVDLDYSWLTFDIIKAFNSSIDSVTSDLSLPSKGKNGCDISWVSKHTGFINHGGSVVRPTYTQGDQTVTLEALISKGSEQLKKTFDIKVKAKEQTDEERAQADYNWLTDEIVKASNVSLDSVTENLNLPARGENGSDILWESDNTTLVNIDGTVTRPTYTMKDREVYLTANISKGGARHKKSFNVTVAALEQSDREAVEEAISLLSKEFTEKNGDLSKVTDNLVFPGTGHFGTTVEWNSDKPSVIDNFGNVTRPSFSKGDSNVNLKLTVMKGTETSEKAFSIIVKRSDMNDVEAVEADLKWLTGLNLLGTNKTNSSITQNLSIGHLKEGIYGSNITWSSSEPLIISNDGIVNRPENGRGHKLVNIKATLTKGSVVRELNLNCTVLEKPDTNGPTVTSTSPEKDSTGVLWDTDKIVITFNEEIKQNNKNIFLYSNNGKTAYTYDYNLTIDKKQMVIEPYIALKPGLNRLVISDRAIADMAGNMTERFELKFYVEEKPVRKIEVSNSVPQHLSNDVSIDIPQVTFNFNFSDIVKGSNFDEIKLQTSDGKVIPTTVSISGSRVTMTLNSTLENGINYEILVPAGAVEDRFENTNKASTIQFRTPKKIIIPRVVSISPANGQREVNKQQPIEIVFSEEVDPRESQLNIYDAQSGMRYSSFPRAKDKNTLNLDINHLLGGRAYYITGPYYSEGNLEAEFKAEFTIPAEDKLEIRGTSPLVNEKDVAIDKTIQIKFPQNVSRDMKYEGAVLKDSDGNSVECSIRTDTSAHITPLVPLKPSTVYTLEIPRGAYTGYSGSIFNNSYSFSFTTSEKVELDEGMLNVAATRFVGKSGIFDADEIDKVLIKKGRVASVYEWDFGDGNTAKGKSVSHKYETEGSYDINLKIKDQKGFTYILNKTTSVEPVNNPVMSVSSGTGLNYIIFNKTADRWPMMDYRVSLTQNGSFVPGETIGVELYKKGEKIKSYGKISENPGKERYYFNFTPEYGDFGNYELVFTYYGKEEQVIRMPISLKGKGWNTFTFRLYDLSYGLKDEERYYEQPDYLYVTINGEKNTAYKRWDDEYNCYVYNSYKLLGAYQKHYLEVDGWSDSGYVYLGAPGDKPPVLTGRPRKLEGIKSVKIDSPAKGSHATIFFTDSYAPVDLIFDADWSGYEPAYYELRTTTGRYLEKLLLQSTLTYVFCRSLKPGEQVMARMVAKNGVTSEWVNLPEVTVAPLPVFMGEKLYVDIVDGEYQLVWPTLDAGAQGGGISALDGMPAMAGGSFGMDKFMPAFSGSLELVNNLPKVVNFSFDLSGGLDKKDKTKKDTKVKGIKKVTAVGYSFYIDLDGNIRFEYQQNTDSWKMTTFTINMDGTLSKTWSAGYSIAGLGGVNGSVEVGGTVGGSLKIDNSGNGTKYSGIIRFTPFVEVSVSGDYGVGSLGGSVKGSIPAQIHFPTGYIGADIIVEAEVYVTFMGWEDTLYDEVWVNEHWDNGKPKVVLKSMLPKAEDEGAKRSTFKPAPRNYLVRPSTWMYGETQQRAGLLKLAAISDNPQVLDIMENIYPKAEIQNVQTGDEQWLIWVDDNPDRDAVNRTQLRYAVQKNGVWTNPSWIGEDETADASPSVASFGDGILMAWHNISKKTTAAEGVEEMIRSSEISVTDGLMKSDGSVPRIINLTNDDKLDHSPRLAANNNKALLVWTKSEGKDFNLINSTESSDQLLYSVWEDGKWSTPASIETSLPAVVDSSLAMSEDKGLLLYTLDMDKDLSTYMDREVYAREFKDGKWGEVIELSGKSLACSAPQAVNINGEWFITWLQDGTLVYRTGLNGEVKADEFSQAIQNDYSLAVKESEEPLIALTYKKIGGNQSQGISVSFYNVNKGQWGNEKKLLETSDYVRNISPTFTSEGEMNIAYTQAEVIIEAIPKGGSDKEFENKITVSDKVDMKILKYTPNHDLALSEEDGLQLSTTYPLPDTQTTVYATVLNQGDFAEYATVELYEGNPLEGGVKIGETAVTELIPAQTSKKVGIQWLVGSEEKSEYNLYAVVKAAADVTESHNENNTIGLKINTSDLEFSNMTWKQLSTNDYYITATILNSGSKTIEGAKLTFSEEKSGELLKTINVAKLEAGDEIELTEIFNIKELEKDEAGQVKLLAELVLPEGLQDAYTDDNIKQLLLSSDPLVVQRSNIGNGDEQVAVTTDMRLVFNKEIQAGTDFSDICLFDDKLNSVSIKATIEKDTLTIVAENELDFGREYTLEIPVNSLKGCYENVLKGMYRLKFKTATLNPEVVFAYPGENMEEVPVSTDIKLKYNQSIVKGEQFDQIRLIKNGTEDIPVSASINGEFLEIRYQGTLKTATTYSLEVPREAVQNENYFKPDNHYQITFTTSEEIPDDEEPPVDNGGPVNNGGQQGGTNTNTSTNTAIDIIIDGKQRNIGVSVQDREAVIDLKDSSKDIFKGSGNIIINAPESMSADSYTMEMTVEALQDAKGSGSLTLNSNIGSITIPAGMLSDMQEDKQSKAAITMTMVDKAKLPENIRAAVGSYPLMELTISIDGEKVQWNNPSAPVKVSIPYKPTQEELNSRESIIIKYVDGSGKVVAVPNGVYDESTGMVTFTIDHFSYFAVGYNRVAFDDVAANAWFNKAVSFIAARNITSGTGNGNYSPAEKLTRGEFLVLIMKAYGIAPDAKTDDNFSDAGNTYYTGYLGAAKRLGITAGTGNNMFNPGKEISRQEMFTLLYNLLKGINQLPEKDSGNKLSDYKDQEQIAPWAKKAMSELVKSNIISGSNSKLTPFNNTTRAEMAQVIYNLLGK